MAVKIGSARIDENGNAHGGKAGDQTGNEVSTQNWYLHKKGWRVFRPKSPIIAEKMAKGMQAACNNACIGYDQYQRHTLYTAAKAVAWQIDQVKTKCETDCSALIRVLLASVGIYVPEDFRTGNMPSYLKACGQFDELTAAKYTTQSVYLRRGDILVTKTNGHTVMVLTNGSKAEPVVEGLRRGDKGTAVTAMQRALLTWKPDCLPKYGADGDFGAETEAALKAYQKASGLSETGVYDAATEKALAGEGKQQKVRITASSVYVRAAPDTSGRILGVVHQGDVLPYQGQNSANGWHLVEYQNENAWISGKYSTID